MPNQTHDKNERPYAKLSQLKAGDKVELDTGFTCHEAGVVHLEQHQPEGPLFFKCADGWHNIEGQADDGEHCVGIYTV